ncbi:MAG TPA: hypothetical protein VGM39_25460 [Kofleriaceae bacterium]
MTSLADYKKLTAKARDHFHAAGGGGVARLAAMLGAAKSPADKALRATILDRISFNTRAAVVFRLAPAPQLVRVEPLTTLATKPRKLRTTEAEALAAAACPFVRRSTTVMNRAARSTERSILNTRTSCPC